MDGFACILTGRLTGVCTYWSLQICYGIIYGMGAKSLGEQMGVEENDAACYIESFKARYKGIHCCLVLFILATHYSILHTQLLRICFVFLPLFSVINIFIKAVNMHVHVNLKEGTGKTKTLHPCPVLCFRDQCFSSRNCEELCEERLCSDSDGP